MRYSVETTSRFDKDFKKLDQYTKRMVNYPSPKGNGLLKGVYTPLFKKFDI